MFKSSSKQKVNKIDDMSVYGALEHLYQVKLLPLEDTCSFHRLAQTPIEKGYFSANAMVLIIGPYSVGKSTFITHLIEGNYPQVSIGPEPTTDGFNIISYGENSTVTSGNSLVVDKTKPYTSLGKFGNSFLQKLKLCTMKNELLKQITFVDTPGILSGKEKNFNRGYEFNQVMMWFAERCDRIILMCDAHKLDISDELKDLIKLVKRYDSKIRVLLNKSDECDSQKLMRVFGAWMWNLGRIVDSPEVPRVYVGSFWDRPLVHTDFKEMMQAEYSNLLSDLRNLPFETPKRKIDDLLQRAKKVKLVAHLVSYLHDKMPIFNAASKKKELINNLGDIYKEMVDQFQMPESDFPELKQMQIALEGQDFTKFKSLNKNKLKEVDEMIESDIPNIMARINKEMNITNEDSTLNAGAFKFLKISENCDGPFTEHCSENLEMVNSLDQWISESKKIKYYEEFDMLKEEDGTALCSAVANELSKSNLQNSILSRIYSLADTSSNDVTRNEYCIMRNLVDMVCQGKSLPEFIPEHIKRS